MNDKWESINSGDPDAKDSKYGQVYDYTTTELSEGAIERQISSGVASYEPFIGRDENPFVQAVAYDQKRKGVPDSRYTFERPIGESFFPGASVGYSEVMVKSIEHTGQEKQHRTGYQISEFFTYKDYPVVTKASNIDRQFSDDNFKIKIAIGQEEKLASAAQGYVIKLNDMHGKPKSNWSYNENDVLLSGVEYKYKQKDDGSLDNEVLAINGAGEIEAKTFGVNVDFSMDSRFMEDVSFRGDADINLDVFVAGVIPLFIPTLWPDIDFNSSLVRTSTVLKVVRQVGLLEKTIAHKEGSKIASDNLLYDSETGQVLLSSVDNEFGNKIYSFNYPAHWAYDDGMGLAFRNWGLELKGIKMDGGTLQSTNSSISLDEMLYPGDICLLNRPGKYKNKKVWVNKTTTDSLVLIDEYGQVLFDAVNSVKDNATTIRILHSGRKNMAGVSIGSVTCMENPLQQSGSSYSLNFDEVLATSAVEYKDEWRTDLSLFPRYDCDTIPLYELTKILSEINTLIDQDYFESEPSGVLMTDYVIRDCDTICDDGYVYNTSTGFCEKIDTTLVQFFGQPYPVIKAATLKTYSEDGAVIYGSIDPKDLPLIMHTYSYNTSSSRFSKGSGGYLDASTILASNSVWKNNLTTTDGRLNISGVWPTLSGDPGNEWIGFPVCFDAPETKEYFFGLSTDNFFKIKINGTEILNTVSNGSGKSVNFTTWHILPINLNKGKNVIELLAYNQNSSDGLVTRGALGAEIYDATESELANISSTTALESKIIFSTKNMIGDSFLLADSSFTCPSGYSLDLCDGSPQCLSIDRAYKGFCDCDVILSTQGYPAKDILEILDDRPLDMQAAILTARVKNEFDEIDTIDLILRSECDTLYQCKTVCTLEERARSINPFINGLRGNWRPYKSWTYVRRSRLRCH